MERKGGSISIFLYRTRKYQILCGTLWHMVALLVRLFIPNRNANPPHHLSSPLNARVPISNACCVRFIGMPNRLTAAQSQDFGLRETIKRSRFPLLIFFGVNIKLNDYGEKYFYDPRSKSEQMAHTGPNAIKGCHVSHSLCRGICGSLRRLLSRHNVCYFLFFCKPIGIPILTEATC